MNPTVPRTTKKLRSESFWAPAGHVLAHRYEGVLQDGRDCHHRHDAYSRSESQEQTCAYEVASERSLSFGAEQKLPMAMASGCRESKAGPTDASCV